MGVRDVRPYRGMIYEVTDPNVKIDFEKYMNPGEITVFLINRLKPAQLDKFVRRTMDDIIAYPWPEAKKLKLLIIHLASSFLITGNPYQVMHSQGIQGVLFISIY